MHVAALYRYSARQNAVASSDRARGEGRSRGSGTFSSTVPEALPCRKFAALYAKDADVWGNILLFDEAELQRWTAFCRPSSREEAEASGGCVIFHPRTTQAKVEGVEPQYFCITATDDSVYGRAAYLSTRTGPSERTPEKSQTELPRTSTTSFEEAR